MLELRFIGESSDNLLIIAEGWNHDSLGIRIDTALASSAVHGGREAGPRAMT